MSHPSSEELASSQYPSTILLSQEALMHIDALSASVEEKNRRVLQTSANSKGSMEANKSSGNSMGSRKGKHGSGHGRARKLKKQAERQGSRKSTLTKEAAKNLAPVGVLSFPPIPSSNDVWNRMFDAKVLSQAGATPPQTDQSMQLQRQQLRHLAKMEKVRQSRLTSKEDTKDNVKVHFKKSLTSTEYEIKQQSMRLRKDVPQSQEVHRRPSQEMMLQAETFKHGKPRLRPRDVFDAGLATFSAGELSSDLETPKTLSCKSSKDKPEDQLHLHLHLHRPPLDPPAQTLSSQSCCWAGIRQMLASFTGSSAGKRKSGREDSKDSTGSSEKHHLHLDGRLAPTSASGTPRSGSDQAKTLTAAPSPSDSMDFHEQFQRSRTSSKESLSDVDIADDKDSDLEEERLMRPPCLPQELRDQVEDASFKDPTIEAMLQNLVESLDNPQSPLFIPSLMQLVILCEYGEKGGKSVVQSFESNNGMQILLKVAGKSTECDSVLIKLMVGAIFSLVLRHDLSAILPKSAAQVNKHVVMILLQCIVDLDTCSPMARAAAPICLTSIFTCLCEMVYAENFLPLQLLTKGIIRRCLKLLECAIDFKNSKELSESQHSAFLCAGFAFLATVAKKGSDTSNLLVKEKVIHRSFAITMSGGNDLSRPEVAALKGLIGSLCSRSENASSQLSAWISENFANSEVTLLAMEVCMSCLGHGAIYPQGQPLSKPPRVSKRKPVSKSRSMNLGLINSA